MVFTYWPPFLLFGIKIMQHLNAILELAAQQPLTPKILSPHINRSEDRASSILKSIMEAGYLTRTQYTTDTKSKKIAYLYTLPSNTPPPPKTKNMRQMAMEHIQATCLFTSNDIAKTLNIPRNSAASALNDLEQKGDIQRYDHNGKEVRYYYSPKNLNQSLINAVTKARSVVMDSMREIHEHPQSHTQQRQTLANIYAILEKALEQA